MSGPQVRHGTQLRIYKKHLLNLQNASRKVDNEAPRLPIKAYIKEGTYYADLSILRSLELQNRKLLKNVNVIYRTKGGVDCQLEKYSRSKTYYTRNKEALDKERKRTEEFLKKLDSKYVVSTYNRKDMLEDWKRILKVMKYSSRYPEFYDKKRSALGTWSLYPKYAKGDASTHKICFLDLKVGDLPKSVRLDIELYNDVVPGTAENFASLCEGFSNLTYQGSTFHRVVTGLWCVGGDIVNHSGTGGMSIYGPTFPDENFTLEHNGPGVVAMYTTEPDSNNSQFLITFNKLTTLNGKFVVFGRVISDLKSLALIESYGTKTGKPREVVRVENCGVYKPRQTKKLSTRSPSSRGTTSHQSNNELQK